MSADPRFALVQVDMAVPRLALTRTEAAASLGMSVDSFERYVQPELRLVRRGSLRVVAVAELQQWLDRNAEWVLGGEAA